MARPAAGPARPAEDLSSRSLHILELLVESYIATGEPVGSRTLARSHGLDVSPATVRNEMMDLEEAGFLAHPYTSAGRVPTEHAFRWFVELRSGNYTLSRSDRQSLDALTASAEGGIQDCLRETSRVLSRLSGCPGMALAPTLEDAVFQHVDFVRLRPAELLVIFVSSAGLIVNRVVRLDEDVPQAQLSRLAALLCERLTGAPLSEIRGRLLDELAHDRALADDLSRRVVEITRLVFQQELEGAVFVSGTSNLLGHPEFTEPDRIRSLFEALEDRERIVNILDRARVAGGICVSIGADAGIDGVDDLVVVSSSYRCGTSALGSIGIIGPTRLDYSRVIPMVEHAAKLISRFLDVR